jgi:VWFA-related protein
MMPERRTPLLIAVMLVLAFSGLRPLGARRGQQPVFRSAVDLVSVNVAVERRGRPVTDLTAADFEVRDSGAVQQIVDLSSETQALDLTLVLDMSGSVEGPLLDSLMRAVGAVTHELRPEDRVRLMTFNHHIHQLGDFAPHLPPLLPQILGAPGGNTALYDALAAALVIPAPVDRRQMAIVFTDGEDTMSFLDGNQALDVASRSGTTVFIVAVTDGTKTVRRVAANQGLLETLAGSTGGSLAVLQRDEDLSSSFVRAFDEFRTSYMLRVTANPAPSPRSDGWHELSVRITRSGSYDVRARRGYFARSGA